MRLTDSNLFFLFVNCNVKLAIQSKFTRHVRLKTNKEELGIICIDADPRVSLPSDAGGSFMAVCRAVERSGNPEGWVANQGLLK